MKTNAFITGVTSGIGKGTTEIFEKNNIKLVLCGRRTERLEKLQTRLSKLTEVTTLQFGVSIREEVYANGNVYCTSKHAINSLKKAMRIDLNKHNIRVAAIHPGAIETNFSKVCFLEDPEKAKAVYAGFKALQAQDVADIIQSVVSRPYHLNIEDLVVYPTAQATPTILNKNYNDQ